MKRTAKKWNLERDVKYNHRVVDARWQEKDGNWKILVEQDGKVFEDRADIFISAQGFLKYVGHLLDDVCELTFSTAPGPGPRFPGSKTSKARRFTPQAGITSSTTATNELR